MSTTIVIGLLVLDFFFGLAVGWWIKSLLASRRSTSPVETPTAVTSADSDAAHQQESQACLDALAGISADMNGHAAALNVFHEALASDRGEEELDGMRSANHSFHSSVSRRIQSMGGLSSLPQNGVKELLSDLGNYQGQIGQLSQTLDRGDINLSDEEVKSVLVSCVQDLLETKEQLASDLNSARREIEEHKVRLERARTEARADVLTGLPNRRAFEEKLDELQREDLAYTVVMFDADRFKALNDTYGHDAGDAALGMIGKVMRTTRRVGDFVFRVGGEEFTLLLPKSDLETSVRVVERYRKKIEAATLRSGQHVLRLTMSAGIAARLPGEAASQVTKRADTALYVSKQGGGNLTCVDDGNETVSADEFYSRAEPAMA